MVWNPVIAVVPRMKLRRSKWRKESQLKSEGSIIRLLTHTLLMVPLNHLIQTEYNLMLINPDEETENQVQITPILVLRRIKEMELLLGVIREERRNWLVK